VKEKLIRIAGPVVLVLAAATMFFSLSGLPPYFDPTVHKEIGRAMARETLGLCKAGGSIIVIKRDTAAYPQPASDAQFKAFRKEIERGKIPIASIQNIQLDPLRLAEVPPGDFLNLIRKASAGSVIVSFLGPPLLSEEQRKTLKEVKPKIVAFCSGNLPERVNIAELFSQNLLHAAVVSKHSVAENRKNSGNVGFSDLYVALNGSNLNTFLKEAIAYAQ